MEPHLDLPSRILNADVDAWYVSSLTTINTVYFKNPLLDRGFMVLYDACRVLEQRCREIAMSTESVTDWLLLSVVVEDYSQNRSILGRPKPGPQE